MSAAVRTRTLLDVPAYRMKEVDELAHVLMEKMEDKGFDKLEVDEQVELRLLRTLLDGYSDE